MRTSIEIVQRDEDKTDYLKLIVELLNKRFTSAEPLTRKRIMELRWGLNCLDVAQELGGKLIAGKDSVVFDFTHII